MLEKTFWQRAQCMYSSGPLEPFIRPSVRDFGFSIERDRSLQRIKLWRALIQSPKGSNEFHGRPSLLKIMAAVVMKWNYSMRRVSVRSTLPSDESNIACLLRFFISTKSFIQVLHYGHRKLLPC